MGKNRILMIDDDADLLELMADVIKMEGYRFTRLPTADNADTLMRTVKPDLVILDYGTPSANGGELCDRLHNSHALQHVPVLLLSAYPASQLPLDRLAFSVFVPKPFDLWNLLAVVHELLLFRIGTAA